MAVTAIVLAGGESRRFGADKALAPVGGSTMLERALLLARSVADEVVVAGRDPGVPWASWVPDDASLPCGGPPRGVASALAAAVGDEVLVLPVDMPFLTAGALRALLEAVESGAPAASVLLGGGSVAANLLAARRAELSRALSLACGKGRLGLRVRMTDLLRASGALLVGAGLLGGGALFLDVDYPGDLEVRGAPRGPRRSVRLAGAARYSRAVELLSSGDRRGAAAELGLEAASYRRDRVWLLELHALLDRYTLAGRGQARIGVLEARLGRGVSPRSRAG